jgi:putative redox protein
MITVRNGSGLRFMAEVRGHTVMTDQTERGGGEDSAISPLEMIPAALGTCVALYAHQFCLARGISAEGLVVEVSYETAPGPKRISRLDLAVRLPAGFPETYRAAIERAVRSCPVHNTLAHGPTMDIRLEATEPEMMPA